MASVTVCLTAPAERSSRLEGPRVVNVSQPETLRYPAEFRRVLDNGGRQRDGDLVVVKVSGQPDCARYGLVAGRRTGNAVQRNRIKRRLRSAITAVGLEPGFDYVFLPGASVATVDFATLCNWVARACR